MADLAYLDAAQRALLVDVLVHHARRDSASCSCGWAELGRSHPQHVVAMFEAELLAATPGDDDYDAMADAGVAPHPLAHVFRDSTWTEPGTCCCGAPLAPRAAWTNPGASWSSTTCPSCGRGYVDEDDYVAIYDHGLDPES